MAILVSIKRTLNCVYILYVFMYRIFYAMSLLTLLLLFFLLGRRSSKSLMHRRLNGIWMKFGLNVLQLNTHRLISISRIFHLTSHFQDGGRDVILVLRRKVLLSGECTRSVRPARAVAYATC